MIQHIGTDPTTGHRLFVDNKGRVVAEIPKCPCCGGEDLLSHPSMFGGKVVCRECGDAWAAYLSGRSRLSIRSSHKVVLNQLSRVDHWLSVKAAGGHTPKGLEQDKENILTYLEFYSLPNPDDNVQMRERTCQYCGRRIQAPVDAVKPRCDECQLRYSRYRWLQTHLGALTLEQCDEFNVILTEYAELLRRGRWAPNIPKYREKIRRRVDELRQE